MSVALEFLEEVIENVLKYVPSKELDNLMLVNSHWHSAAKRIKKRRNWPSWIYWSNKDTNKESLDKCYSDIFNNMYQTPNTTITFLSELYVRSGIPKTKTRSVRKRLKMDLQSFFENGLPALSQHVQIASAAVVGTERDTNKIAYCSSLAAASIFWPRREDLAVKIQKNLKDADLDLPCDDLSPKLLMLFVKVDRRPSNRNKILKTKCIVAGCSVTTTSFEEPETGLVFFGKPNVEVASVVVTESHKKMDQIEQKLSEFLPFLRNKFNVRDKNEKFDVRKYLDRIQGYVFACVNRLPEGDQTSLDLEAFAKVFPGVPLFGLYGYGEIGFDATCQGALDELYAAKGFFDRDSLMNYNSSVFVLITF